MFFVPVSQYRLIKGTCLKSREAHACPSAAQHKKDGYTELPGSRRAKSIFGLFEEVRSCEPASLDLATTVREPLNNCAGPVQFKASIYGQLI